MARWKVNLELAEFCSPYLNATHSHTLIHTPINKLVCTYYICTEVHTYTITYTLRHTHAQTHIYSYI